MTTLEVPILSVPNEVTDDGFWSSFTEFCEQQRVQKWPAVLNTAKHVLQALASEDLQTSLRLKAPTTFLLSDTSWYQSRLVRIAGAIELLVQARMLTPAKGVRREYEFDYTLMELSDKRTFIRADLNGSSVMVVA